MKARICDRCGGKLPDTDTRIVKCEYCGTPVEMYEGPEVPKALMPRGYRIASGDCSSMVTKYWSTSIYEPTIPFWDM